MKPTASGALIAALERRVQFLENELAFALDFIDRDRWPSVVAGIESRMLSPEAAEKAARLSPGRHLPTANANTQPPAGRGAPIPEEHAA